jgi:hypothetical protein
MPSYVGMIAISVSLLESTDLAMATLLSFSIAWRSSSNAFSPPVCGAA